MAATVTSGNVFLEPTNIFRHYDGPPKPKRIRKRNQTLGRKVNPSPNIPFTDIDDILRSDLAEPGLVPEFGGDAVEGGSQDNPITIEESESDTDTEDELPALEELLVRRHLSNKEASVASAAESRITHGGTWSAVGHQDDGSVHDGDAMQPVQRSEGGPSAHASSEAAVGSLITPTTTVITNSGDLPRPEDGDGSGGDDGGATGTGLLHDKQRKRPRSLPSVNTTVRDLGTPDPDHDLDPDPEMLREGPRLPKRQRLHLRAAGESTPTRTPTPTPNTDLSQSSVTSSGDTHDRMDIEQPSTECNGEAIGIGIGGSDASNHAKTADREGTDELPQSIKRTMQRVRATARRHRTKPSRTAALAISSAQRSATEPMDQRTPDPETRSPAAEPAPVPPPYRPAHSAVREGTARLESHDDARWIPYPPPEVTEMFMAVTIQTAGDMLQMSSNEPAKLIESASAYAGKAEDVTIRPLGPAGTWQISGRLRLRNGCSRSTSRPVVGREPTPAGGNPSWDLRKRARALCESAVYGTEVGAKGNGILNDGHRRLHDGGSGDGDGGDGDGDDEGDDDYEDDGYEVATTCRRNRRWDPLDDQRLLAWRKEKKSWKWIFDQFPYRTEPAVRVRWHLLQRSAQREE